VLLHLAYQGITNAFALLRLLPGSDRDKDAEILALRHHRPDRESVQADHARRKLRNEASSASGHPRRQLPANP